MKRPRVDVLTVIRDVLNEHDPMLIHTRGVNDDEYDQERTLIVEALRASPGPDELAEKLPPIFWQMFNKESVRFAGWNELADDLWERTRGLQF